jgi:hypothetical protein
MEDLGFKFWAGLAGIVIAAGIACLILFLIITRAFYAWGAFGMLLVLGLVLLAIGWFYDRRQARLYDE